MSDEEVCKNCGKVHKKITPEEKERINYLHLESTSLMFQLMEKYSPADAMYVMSLTSAMMTIATKPEDAQESKRVFLSVYDTFVDNMVEGLGLDNFPPPPPGKMN